MSGQSRVCSGHCHFHCCVRVHTVQTPSWYRVESICREKTACQDLHVLTARDFLNLERCPTLDFSLLSRLGTSDLMPVCPTTTATIIPIPIIMKTPPPLLNSFCQNIHDARKEGYDYYGYGYDYCCISSMQWKPVFSPWVNFHRAERPINLMLRLPCLPLLPVLPSISQPIGRKGGQGRSKQRGRGEGNKNQYFTGVHNADVRARAMAPDVWPDQPRPCNGLRYG